MPNALSCASEACAGADIIVVAGVPLCGEHRQILGRALGPRAAYRSDRPWFVYYITWPHTASIVKIGASANLSARFRGHGRGGHWPEVLAVEPAGLVSLEAMRHEQFASLQVALEEFRREPPLTAHIAAVRKAHPDWLKDVKPLPWWLDPANTAKTFAEIPLCGAPRLDGKPCTLPSVTCRYHPQAP
jgi:hypothetical protein